MNQINVNLVLTPVEGAALLEKPTRVLDIDRRSRLLLLISMEANLKKPWIANLDDFLHALKSGQIRVSTEEPMKFMMRLEDEIPDAQKCSRDQAWLIIKELVEHKLASELFSDGCFGSIVARHAAKMGVTRKKVYSLLYRYWAYGQTKNALLLDTTKFGAPGKRRIATPGKTLGRPPKYRGLIIERVAVPISELHLLSIETAFARFSNGEEGSMRSAFDWMLKEYYLTTYSDGSPGKLRRNEHPTFRQFTYYSAKYFDALRALMGRGGMIRWNKDYRPLTGTSVDGLAGPCHRYEVDATIADVYLVHRVNRNWLIGRPVLYVVVDAYSRMIVGIHVGLEGPSWEGARHALYNAFTPKIDFCKRYGIEIAEEDWPCHHIPIEISADRGELLSKAGESMTNALGPTLKIAPPFRPDWKAIVESRFHIINKDLNLKFIPGGVDARRQERGDRDYELDAVLDIDMFTRLIIYQVLKHNKTLHLPHLATNRMVEDEVHLNPLSIWEWGMQESIINCHVRPSAEIKIALLPSADATVRRGGIFFKGILYTCDLAEKEQWFARSHNLRMQRVKIWYDPNSADNVWIRDGGDFLPLRIVDYEVEKYSGFRLEEIEDRYEALRHPSPDERYVDLNESANLKAHIDVILEQAKELKKKSPPRKSKADFKANKREKRASEADVERAADVQKLHEIRLGEILRGASPIIADIPKPDVSPRKKAILQLVHNSLRGAAENE
ncbi:Mu transposase C-terminal domain-containing protein [Pseudomonas sp. NPDC086251]|uniref:Mu transposase C-terminal domain-containing protein n=1 Tax=Pseudomonas sp. NPDC086251 TaxID=3364431 RepID=UPI003835BBDB